MAFEGDTPLTASIASNRAFEVTLDIAPFEGTWWTQRARDGSDGSETVFRVPVQAPSVTVITAMLRPSTE